MERDQEGPSEDDSGGIKRGWRNFSQTVRDYLGVCPHEEAWPVGVFYFLCLVATMVVTVHVCQCIDVALAAEREGLFLWILVMG